MRQPSLRVLMTADAVGGVFRYAGLLAGAIAERGGQVHLVLMGPPPRAGQLEPLRGIAGVSIELTDLALEWLDPEGTDLLRARRRLTAIANRFAPDVVHINGYREATFGYGVPVLLAAHSCVGSWWRACRGSWPQQRRWQCYLANVGQALATAQLWTAPTAAHRQIVTTLYAPASAGLVINNGIDPLGGARKQPVILAAGRLWDEAKNIAALTYAARHLSWPIRVAGATRPPLASHISVGAAGLVILGELSAPQLAAEMRRAAIFASAAFYEPFGLAVLEAASTGCALVLADIASFRELWDGAAWFVDPRQPRDIYRALDRLCRDDELRARLQRAAATRSAQFSLERMTDAYLHAYQGLCGQTQARQPSPEVAA